MIDFGRFTHMTFDCYGTLIDWEAGILDAVTPVLARQGKTVSEPEIFRIYAAAEAAEEAGPFKRYRDVLRGVMGRIGQELGFEATEADRDALADSVGTWQPFPDSAEALRSLKQRYRLVILSNVDDAMFRDTSALLGDPFDAVFTSERIGSYKPALDNFRHAVARLAVPQEQILHVAQSLFHDHAPAKSLGFTTVRVNRPSRCPGTGVAPPTDAAPDHEVPDMRGLVAGLGL